MLMPDTAELLQKANDCAGKMTTPDSLNAGGLATVIVACATAICHELAAIRASVNQQ
jgi:hypothetical protein